jgi:hypothetical protein
MVDGTVAALAHDVAPLGELRAPAGVYFVIGNHELYSWRRAVAAASFAGLGLTPLRNQHVALRRGDAALVLAGVDDHTGGKLRRRPRAALRRRAGRPADPSAPGGACWPTSRGRSSTRSATASRCSCRGTPTAARCGRGTSSWRCSKAGGSPACYRRAGPTTLYVCRGAGYWGPPVRVGAPPEIARIVLRAPR